MADPLAHLQKLVNRQKLVIATQQETSATLAAEREKANQAEKAQPNPTVKPAPSVSVESDV